MSSIAKTSEIRFKIGLDDKNIPQDIKWLASDTVNKELVDCKCIMISIWDPVKSETLGIELWTNEMTTDEMHSQYFQTLLNITDSYQRATGNPFVAKDMEEFCRTLASKTSDWESKQQ